MIFDQETRTEIHRQRFTRAELARIDAECTRLTNRERPKSTGRWTRSRLLRVALDRYFRGPGRAR